MTSRSNTTRGTCIAALMTVFLAGGSIGLAVEPFYVPEDIGSLGGQHTQVRAMNDLGQVVGRSTTSSFDWHAFVWSRSAGMIDLGIGEATALNNNGLIIGLASGEPVVWEDGVATPLTHSDGFARANGLNDLDVIVGGDGSQAVKWIRSGETWIEESLGQVFPPYNGSRAYDINNSGWITGGAFNGRYDDENFPLWDAFRLTDSTVESLGTLSYGSTGEFINATGEVAGTSLIYYFDYNTHPFFYPEHGPMLDISPTEYTEAYVQDMNDAGQVIVYGWGENDFGDYWEGSYIHDYDQISTTFVKDLFLPYSLEEIDRVEAINNSGALAASRASSPFRGYLLHRLALDCNGNGTNDLQDLIGTLYVTDDQNLHLVTAPDGSELSAVGPLAVDEILGLARHPQTGVLYIAALIGSDRYLATVDEQTAAVTPIGQLGGFGTGSIVDIAFGPDGTLYGTQDDLINVFDGYVSEIDVSNPSLVTPLFQGTHGVWQTITVHPVSGDIYQYSSGGLVRFDGVVSDPISIPMYALGGMAFHPITDNLLGYSSSGYFLSIDLDTGDAEVVSLVDYNEITGMALAPQASDADLDFVPDGCTTGDATGDGNVTIADYSSMHGCLTGPNGFVPPGCLLFDFDADGDVDLQDATGFADQLVP